RQQHRRDGVLGYKEHRLHVHLHHPTPTLRALIDDTAAAADPDIVVEQVHASEAVERRVDQRPALLFVGDISFERDSRAALGSDHRHGALGEFDLTVNDKDLHATSGEQHRGSTAIADAVLRGAAAGNDGNLAGEARRIVVRFGHGSPAPGTSTAIVSMRPSRLSAAGSPLAEQVQMKSVLRSGPPSMQAYEPSAPVEISRSMRPPSNARTTRLPTGSATQIAPSSSRQMPSGKTPSNCANTRRLARPPSASMSNAVSRCAYVSPMMSVRPSGVITVPFGNSRSSAATVTAPSGSTRTMHVVCCGAPCSKPKLPT